MGLIANTTETPAPAPTTWPELIDGTYPEPPVGNGASFTISTVSQPTIVGPAAVWFEASGWSGFVPTGPTGGQIYDPRLHKITYIWTVRGRAVQGYSAPINMVTEWNNERIAYGARVVLPFKEADTYTVDCWAIDGSGNIGRQSTQITVQSADSVYSGSRTIAVALSGGHTGAPPGAQEVGTLSAAQSIINSASQPHRLLLKRGETYTGNEIQMTGNGLGYVGAYGADPAKPILSRVKIDTRGGQGSSTTTQVTQFTMAGLRYEGGWDVTTQSGTKDDPIGFNLSFESCFYHIYDCEFDAIESLSIGTKNNSNDIIPNCSVAITDCVVSSWRDYGIFQSANSLAPGSRISIIGTRVSQNPDAFNNLYSQTLGLNNSDPNRNLHAPIRLSSAENYYLAVLDLFTRHGWASNDQPCLRWGTDGEEDVYGFADRIVGEGGRQIIGLWAQDSANNSSPANYIIDKALLISSTATRGQFAIASHGGFTFRNTIGVRMNGQIYPTGEWNACIDSQVSTGGQSAGNNDEPIAIYNCTFYSALNSTNDNGGDFDLHRNDSGFTDRNFANNVLHAPATGGNSVTADAPIDISATLTEITTRYKGVKVEFENGGAMQTAFGTDGQNPVAPEPQPGSPAYQSATGEYITYDDFFMRPRGVSPSRGAVEPQG